MPRTPRDAANAAAAAPRGGPPVPAATDPTGVPRRTPAPPAAAAAAAAGPAGPVDAAAAVAERPVARAGVAAGAVALAGRRAIGRRGRRLLERRWCSTTGRGMALVVSGRGVGGARAPGSSGQHGSHAGTRRRTDDTPTGRAPRAQPRLARSRAAGAEGGRRPRVAAQRAATSGRGAWPRFPLVSTSRLGGLFLHCT